MTVDDRWFNEALGADCSPIGVYELQSSKQTAAYVLYRGVIIAAVGADADAAKANLKSKIEAHEPQLAEIVEIPAVEDVNLVADRTDRPPERRFARAMSPQRALFELDLGIDGALVFLDETDHRFGVMSRSADGRPQLIRVGEAVHGDDFDARAVPIPGTTPTSAEEQEARNEKATRIRAILRCPLCRGELSDSTAALRCDPCERDYPIFDGKPVLARDPDYDPSPRGAPESKNPYGAQVLELIESNRDAWVLDMGSGSPSQGFYNVAHLDLYAYDHVDVITDGRSLPFADETFAAIASEAVLEHVENPDEYMEELVRVLKPGGKVRLDAAFMQPYHGYPDHYFNMTRSGLRVVVERAGLEVLSLSIGEHQHPFVTLGLVMGGFVHGTKDEGVKQGLCAMTIGDALQKLETGGSPLFKGLTKQAMDRLAAGFCCLARKPARS